MTKQKQLSPEPY